MRSLRNITGRLFGSLFAIVTLSTALRAQNDAQPKQSAPAESQASVVVLQDGGVLSGSVRREGQRYVVTRAGGAMQIPAAKVKVVCGSLDEAYNRQRELIRRPSAEAHLALADWCLRNNLLPQATRELINARQLDAVHPRLRLLERRLAQANLPWIAAPPHRGDAVQPSREGEGALPEGWSAEPFTLAQKQLAPADPATTDLSHDVVEKFTRRVQPILVNNCTTSRCHAPGGTQQFQFDRASLHDIANRRTTMQNLAAALALVDRQQPEKSPLLTVGRQTHGGMDGPIFGLRQEAAFKHLVEWVLTVAPPPQPKSETTVPLAAEECQLADSPAAAGTLRVEQPRVTGQVTAAKAAPEKDGDVAPANLERAESPLRPRQPLRVGAQVKEWTPRDPFDPEIFNRRYRQNEGDAPAGD
jgi:hypothetical protein